MPSKFLKELTQFHGLSGFEDEVRMYIKSEAEKNGFKTSHDKLGSIVATKCNGVNTVALVAHMDEVGFIVKYIDKNGFIYFETVGNWWKQSILNHKVSIKTKNSKINGIIGSISPHALSDDMIKNGVNIKDMYIDIGANSLQDVIDEGIEIGNPICPIGEYEKLNDKLISKALDDRAGCSILLDMANICHEQDYNLSLVGTAQEEVGLRGAQASAHIVNADIAIILDVTICGDSPGINEKDFQTNMNQGPSICVFDKRTIPNQKLLNFVKEVSKNNNIPIQYYSMSTGATDGGRYNVVNAGSAVISIAIPSRYIHANNSMISSTDYIQTRKLVCKLLQTLSDEKISEIINFE
ncbi:MAG: M42 family metallopeptidase [Mycoplasmatales bacterium]